MNVLITAGGTCERIDSVRSITNHATGRLGSLIADSFAGINAQITYVCSKAAVLPKSPNVKIVFIEHVDELMKTLDALLHKEIFDCCIHSMAVSDYTPQAVLSVDEMVDNVVQMLRREKLSLGTGDIEDRMKHAILQGSKPIMQKKISSDKSDIAIVLKQTPKVIKSIKSIQPQTILVGFKLLSGVTEEDLLQAGMGLLEKNFCDFVVANDLEGIEHDKHKAIFIDKKGKRCEVNTKQEIAEMILTCVVERME